MQEKIRQARHECGMSQSEAAELLGRPQSYVSRCETGMRRIDIIDLIDFGRIYKKSIQYFLPKEIIIKSINELPK